MNRVVACSLLLTGLFSFTGCFEREIKTVEYFKSHPEEMQKKVDECKKAQTMSETDKKECENAAQALAMKNYFKPVPDDFFRDRSADDKEQNTTK